MPTDPVRPSTPTAYAAESPSQATAERFDGDSRPLRRRLEAHLTALLPTLIGARLTDATGAVLVSVGQSEAAIATLVELAPGHVGTLWTAAGDGAATVRLIAAETTAERRNRSLSRELLVRYEELNVLYGLIEALGTTLDEPTAARLVLDQALQILSVAAGAVLTTDGGARTIAAREGDERWTERLTETGAAVIDSGQPVLLDGPDGQASPGLLLAVPLVAGHQPVGALVLAERRHGGPFTSNELKLMTALGGHAGTHLNACRMIREVRRAESMRRELELAHGIQQRLLPQGKPPDVPGFELFGVCRPAAEVGGDGFDWLDRGDGSCWLSLTDVSGHGVGAALLMASLRSSLRSSFDLATGDVAQLVGRANRLMCADVGDDGHYATLIVGRLDGPTRRLTLVNAGHCPPLLRRADGRIEPLEAVALPVGMMPGEPYPSVEIALAPGDLLLIYTDGVTESRAPDGEMFGEPRLHRWLAAHRSTAASATVADLLVHLDQFQAGTPSRDDVTLLVIKAMNEER